MKSSVLLHLSGQYAASRARLAGGCPGRLRLPITSAPLCACRNPPINSLHAHASATSTADTTIDVVIETADEMEGFLGWCVANGAEESSAVSVFYGADGDRGVCSTRPISKGEVLVRVPLRIAIADHAGDEETNLLVFPGAPWAVRLACKLLRELKRGPQSPWCAGPAAWAAAREPGPNLSP